VREKLEGSIPAVKNLLRGQTPLVAPFALISFLLVVLCHTMNEAMNVIMGVTEQWGWVNSEPPFVKIDLDL
jgi:hypothetical protein